MDRVETQVAIAFGASVQPFTSTTPSVSSMVISSAGLCAACCTSSQNPCKAIPPQNFYI